MDYKNPSLQFKKMLAWFPYILVFYEITNYLANDMYLPALPEMARDLHVDNHYAQMTLTAWFLGTASMQLILGPLSDRFGRRPTLLGGGILFTLATFVCAVSSNIHVILIARFFQGGSVCTIGTAGYSSIHECFDQKRAIRLLAIMGSITILAPAFGPLAGSILLQWYSWRFIFALLGVWAIIALFILWLWMPESNPKEKQHPLDWPLIFRNYSAIVTNPIFTLNTLIFSFIFLGLIGWIVLGPFLVIEKFHLSAFDFGIFQALIFGSLILSSQLIKYLLDKITVSTLIKMGLIISLSGGTLGFILALSFPQFILGLIVSLMIFTFGASLAFGPSHRIAIEACAEPMGAKMAVYSSIISVSGVLGSLIVSILHINNLLWLASLLLLASMLALCTKGLADIATAKRR